MLKRTNTEDVKSQNGSKITRKIITHLPITWTFALVAEQVIPETEHTLAPENQGILVGLIKLEKRAAAAMASLEFNTQLQRQVVAESETDENGKPVQLKSL